MMAGPKSVIESFSAPAGSALVMKTYVWPWIVSGILAVMVDPLGLGSTARMFSPFTNTVKIPCGTDPSTVKSNVFPGAAGKAWAAVKLGKGRTGKMELVGGQDVMNPAARVNTAFSPRPVPYGLAAATSPSANRCKLV